jgi:hypothetical protein
MFHGDTNESLGGEHKIWYGDRCVLHEALDLYVKKIQGETL